MRVFSNINPEGAPCLWRLGEPFADVAGRVIPRLRSPSPRMAGLLDWCGITKGRQTAYDRLMLKLRDGLGAEANRERDGRSCEFTFPAGSTWIAYTDIVLHAALAGRHALGQTFYLPVDAMLDPGLSPLRLLERLTGRRLVGDDETAVATCHGYPEMK